MPDKYDPKYGKIDPTGAPHVGGDTWAGGTGLYTYLSTYKVSLQNAHTKYVNIDYSLTYTTTYILYIGKNDICACFWHT